TSGFDRELHLGADAVGSGDEDGIGEAGAFEIKQSAEPADLSVSAGAGGRAHQRLDQVHHAGTPIAIGARRGGGEGLGRPFVFPRGWYAGIAGGAMVRYSPAALFRPLSFRGGRRGGPRWPPG